MSTPTVKELRSKLKELGLETGGRKADLISRLNKASLETKKTPEDEASVIVSNKIRLQNDDAMIANSRQTLPSTIRDEEFYVEYINDDVFVGNRRGISYAYSKSENRTLESRITSLEQSNATLEQSNATLTSEVSSLSTAHSRLASEVQDLRLSLVDYTLFRNRFLSTYKRKVLKNATPHDHDMINRGSSVAHGGDCRRDAELYGQPGGRRDGDVYRDLYGVSPNIVRALITYPPTITALNKHASLKSDQLLSKECQDQFSKFISALKDFDYPEDFLDEVNSKVAGEYYLLMDMLGNIRAT